MNGKGRPEKLTDDLKKWITIHQQGRKKKLKAPAIQEELRLYLEAQVKKDNPSFSNGAIQAAIEGKLPGFSSIQKYLKELQDRDKPFDIDKPWHLGTIEDYPVPAKAIPFIFLVQDWLEKYPDSFNNPPPQAPLTVRQAIWISRLYAMIDREKIKREKFRPSIARYLFLWAEAYATREAICYISGTPPDTTSLDKQYRQSPGYPITVNKTTIIHYPDGSIYIDTIDEKLLQQAVGLKLINTKIR